MGGGWLPESQGPAISSARHCSHKMCPARHPSVKWWNGNSVISAAWLQKGKCWWFTALKVANFGQMNRNRFMATEYNRYVLDKLVGLDPGSAASHLSHVTS